MPLTPLQELRAPHSLEAERALLGSVLLDNAALDVALDLLSRGDFFSEANRIIYDTMLRLSSEGGVINVVVLINSLGADTLEKINGASYIASLTDGVPIGNFSAVREYARIVRDKSLLRGLIHFGNNVVARAFEDEDAESCINLAISELLEIDAGKDADVDLQTFRAAGLNLLTELEHTENFKRLVTGITEFDKRTGGFLPTELVLYTAETGVGKTILLQQTRRESCKRGLHMLIASAEMRAEQLLSREIAIASGVHSYKFRQPEHLTKQDWDALVPAVARQCERCMILDGELTMPRIAAAARRMKAAAGLDGVGIDYDELVTSPAKNETEAMALVARAAKSLAKSLNVPVILVSQLKKALSPEERANPSLDRLYGSSAKQKHASIVVFVNREFQQTLSGDDTKAEIVILKSRDGRLGAIRNLAFNFHTLSFVELTQIEAPDAN